jgi:hypothetical protein
MFSIDLTQADAKRCVMWFERDPVNGALASGRTRDNATARSASDHFPETARRNRKAQARFLLL